MAKPTVSLSVLAYRLNLAMSLGHEVVVEMRTRPPSAVVGRVTSKRIDERRKLDPKRRDQSRLVYTVDGREVEVERIADVRVKRR